MILSCPGHAPAGPGAYITDEAQLGEDRPMTPTLLIGAAALLSLAAAARARAVALAAAKAPARRR